MRFSVLGPVSVVGTEGPEPLGAPRQAALLAVLIMEGGRSLRTHTLADLLWDGERVTDAALRVTLQRLKRRLEALGHHDVFSRSRGVIGLSVEQRDVDAWTFEAELARARSLRTAGRHQAAVSAYDSALGRFGGRPYEDVLELPALGAESTRLLELGRAAELELLAAMIASGDPASAGVRSRNPQVIFDEDAMASEQLACLGAIGLGRAGRWEDAQQVLEGCQRWLLDDWGLEPSSTLVALRAESIERDTDLFGSSLMDRFAPLAAAAHVPAPDPSSRRRSGYAAPGASRLLQRHSHPPLVGRLEESVRCSQHLEPRSERRVLWLRGARGVGRSRTLALVGDIGIDLGWSVLAVTVDEALASTVDQLESELRALGLEVDAPTESIDDVSLAAETLAERIAALARCVNRHRDPILILVDDIESIGEASLVTILELGNACPEVSWVCADSRESTPAAERLFAELGRRDQVSLLELAPLDADAMTELAEHLAPGGDPEVIRSVIDSSGGVVADVIEQWRFAAAVGEWDGDPSVIERFVASQVAALESVPRRLLEAVAVTGSSLTLDVARQALAPGPEEDLAAAAEELVSRRLLADGSAPDSFVVAAALVADVIFERLRPRDLNELRLAVAGALGSAAQAATHARLLMHLDASWWPADADDVVHRALAHLLHQSAYGVASELGAAYVDLGGTDRPGPAALGSRVLAATAMVAAGDPRGRALAKMARAQARSAGDAGLIADAAAALAPISSGKALPADDLEELRALIPSLGDQPARQVTVGCWVAHLLTIVGQNQDALEVVKDAETLAADLSSPRLRGLATGIRYQACTGIGIAPSTADRALADLTSLHELSRDPTTNSIWALSMLSAAHRDGDPAAIADALGHLDGAIERSPRPDLPWVRAAADAARLLLSGDVDAASQAVRESEQIGVAHNIDIAAGIAALHNSIISWESGSLASMRDFLPASAGPDAGSLVGASLRAVADVEAEQWSDAELVLHNIGEIAAPLERSGQAWPCLAALLGQAAFETSHEVMSRRLLDDLQRHRGRGLGMYVFGSFGAVDRVAGMAAATLGDLDLGVQLLTDALRQEEAREMPTWAARSRVALRVVLTSRGLTGDAERAAALQLAEPLTPGVEAFARRARERFGSP